jgi:hypothetical protein
MSLVFDEPIEINLAERTPGNLNSPVMEDTPAAYRDQAFVVDVVQFNVAEHAHAPADSFGTIMSNGKGSVQALIDSSQSMKDTISVHTRVIDRVMAQHGGLKNYKPSALFETPEALVASITGDASLASLFKAQSIAKGLYPAGPLSERSRTIVAEFDGLPSRG